MNVGNWQYERFGEFLREQTGSRVTLSFARIQEIIGTRLPSSARNHQAWWSNSPSHPLAKVWLEVGWECPPGGVSLSRQELTLERRGQSTL